MDLDLLERLTRMNRNLAETVRQMGVVAEKAGRSLGPLSEQFRKTGRVDRMDSRVAGMLAAWNDIHGETTDEGNDDE